MTVDIGHDTELTCSATGHPAPAITWRKDGLPLRETSHRIRILGETNSQLRITGVVREDRGMYQCFAKNDYEMSQGTAELSLGGKSSPENTRRTLSENLFDPSATKLSKRPSPGDEKFNLLPALFKVPLRAIVDSDLPHFVSYLKVLLNSEMCRKPK